MTSEVDFNQLTTNSNQTKLQDKVFVLFKKRCRGIHGQRWLQRRVKSNCSALTSGDESESNPARFFARCQGRLLRLNQSRLKWDSEGFGGVCHDDHMGCMEEERTSPGTVLHPLLTLGNDKLSKNCEFKARSRIVNQLQ